MSLNMLGASSRYYGRMEIGFFGDLLQAGTELTSRGLDAYDKNQADEAASSAAKGKLQAAIDADAASALATASALSSAAIAAKIPGGPRKATADAKAAADQSAADLASSAQDDAGGQVPAALAPQRIAAARKGLAAATAKLQASPQDAYAQGLAKAWQQAVTKAQYGQIVKNAPASGAVSSPSSGESWLSQKTIIKSLPNYGTVAGGLGILGLGWLAVKKGLLHRFGIG